MVKCTNRYGDVFTFTKQEDGNILWEGDFEYCRYGWPNNPDGTSNTNIINMVDPSGGPYITEGTNMKRFGLKGVVKEFLPNDNGYLIIIK